MAEEFDRHIHTFVVVDIKEEAWKQPLVIVLHTGDRVWVHGSHDMVGSPNVVIVNDGVGPVYDQDGFCILSVPAEGCKYYDPDEAGTIYQVMEADDQMRFYAR